MVMHSKHDRLEMSQNFKSQQYLKKGWSSLFQHILTKIVAYESQWNHSSIIYEKIRRCHHFLRCHQPWTGTFVDDLAGLNESLGANLTDEIGHVSYSDL